MPVPEAACRVRRYIECGFAFEFLLYGGYELRWRFRRLCEEGVLAVEVRAGGMMPLFMHIDLRSVHR